MAIGAALLGRGRRRRVQVDLEGGQLLVQPVDGVAGDVEAAGVGEHHRLLVEHQIGAAFLDQLLQDRPQRLFHGLARLGKAGLELFVLALRGALQRLHLGLEGV